MNRIAKFMLLDFHTLPRMARIYLISFLVVGMISFFVYDLSSLRLNNSRAYSFLPKPLVGVIWGSLVHPVMVMAQLASIFHIAKTNRLETLYATLSLTRDDIVKARYLFFICVQTILMLPPLFIKPIFFPGNESVYFHMTMSFMVASSMTALSYPFAFRKNRSVAAGMSISSLGFIFIVFIFYQGFRGQLPGALSIFTASPLRTVAVGVILLYVSYLLSLKIYKTQDL